MGESAPFPAAPRFHTELFIGYKDEKEVTPSGLIERSKADGSDGVVFVSLNYRLGMFGFLNVEGDDQVEPNAGLHDQRLALEW